MFCTDDTRDVELFVLSTFSISDVGIITNFILESSVGNMIISSYFAFKPFSDPLSEVMCCA